ncbi:MAG: hypothetical protein ACJ71Q_00080 [Terriglobales bacterium]
MLVVFASSMFAQVGGGMGAGIGGEIAIGAGPREVRGVPFSADVTTEFTRILTDGNRIHQENHGKIYRDSEGRTRTENSTKRLPDGQPWEFVFINDPVSNVTINLDPQRKTATIFRRSTMNAAHIQPNPLPPVEAQSEAKEPVIKVHHEELGTASIDGYTVTGTKFTRTTEAGAIGNDQPLVIVSESWRSNELKEVLLSKTNDPQTGETIRKLTNIQRLEPDPVLFQVPPGYTTRDVSPPQ